MGESCANSNKSRKASQMLIGQARHIVISIVLHVNIRCKQEKVTQKYIKSCLRGSKNPHETSLKEVFDE